MKERTSILIVILGMVMLTTMTVPASAVVQEIMYRGQVVSINQSGGTMTINAGYQYGCNYTGATPDCSWGQVPASNLTGTVPDPAALNVFRAGDPIAATSIGGPGGTWIGLAKIFPTPGIEHWLATDIIGDPDSLPVGLASDYYFSYETAAECGNCTGSVCNGRYANVTLNSTDMIVLRKSLTPGETAFYNGRNDNSSVLIRFVKGQALSDTCPGMAGIVGMQPISVFTIHVTQAIAGPIARMSSQISGTPTPALQTTMPAGSPLPVSYQSTRTPASAAQTPVTSSPSPGPTKAPSDLFIPFASLGITGFFLLRKVR